MEFIHSVGFKVSVAFIIGLLIGGGSVWSWSNNGMDEEETEDISSGLKVVQEPIVGKVNVTSDTELSKNSAIHVDNQSSGSNVVIKKVILEEDGWVVVHEGTESSIGNALGAVRLSAGEHETTVPLLRVTEPGGVYRVVLYRDNGDREFSLDSDFPVIDSSGGPIMTMFLTTN